jgi:transposase
MSRLRHDLALRNITPVLARRGEYNPPEVQEERWKIERALAWLRRFRRLAMRYERSGALHQAFLTLGCIVICHNHWVRFC